MSSKELSKIKELAAKVQELEDMLNKLLRDMKTLNLNELREQIADAHRKLSLKASSEELETAKTDLSEDYNKKIDALKPLLDKFKHLEMAVNDNKDNIYKHDFRVRYYWVYITSLSQLDKLESLMHSFRQELSELKESKGRHTPREAP